MIFKLTANRYLVIIVTFYSKRCVLRVRTFFPSSSKYIIFFKCISPNNTVVLFTRTQLSKMLNNHSVFSLFGILTTKVISPLLCFSPDNQKGTLLSGISLTIINLTIVLYLRPTTLFKMVTLVQCRLRSVLNASMFRLMFNTKVNVPA